MRKITLFFLLITTTVANAQKVLHVGVAGLTHDHVHNIMNQFKRGEVVIAGIAESDAQLVQR